MDPDAVTTDQTWYELTVTKMFKMLWDVCELGGHYQCEIWHRNIILGQE
jgi:hypothetical protein